MDAYITHYLGIAEPERLYAILAGLLLLVFSGWVAARELGNVRILAPSDFTRKFPGRQPWSKQGIEKRIAALENFKRSKMLHFVWHLGLLALFGLIVPSVLLGAAVMNYGWLSGGDTAFVASAQAGSPVSHPSLGQAVMFVLSQLIQSPTDILEIFKIDLSPIHVGEGQTIMRLGVLVYHLFIGGFVLVIFYTAYLLFRVSFGIDPKLQQLVNFKSKLYPFKE